MSRSCSVGSRRLRPWKILKTRELFVAKPWIRLSVDQVRLPDSQIVEDYYQLDLTEFVVIFAQTKEGKVMERQYKHGVRKVSLTLPTGGLDKREDPLRAAKRELLEETGYVSRDWRCLGHLVQLGNYGGGRAHLFVARNAWKTASPRPHDLEEMEIILLDLPKLMKEFRSGQICVLSTVAAVALATHPILGRLWGKGRSRSSTPVTRAFSG